MTTTSTLDAIQTLENHGMEFVSTKIQIKNGTYVFKDVLDKYPKTLYGMFLPTGYVRKMGEPGWSFGFGNRRGERRWYQLNRVIRTKTKYGWSVERVLIPNDIDKMLKIILRVSNKSRNRK